MSDMLYVCDQKRMIQDGKCNGSGCFMGKCYLTKNIEYAKPYVNIFELRRYTNDMVDFFKAQGDTEKAGQFKNAYNSVCNVIEQWDVPWAEYEGRIKDDKN